MEIGSNSIREYTPERGTSVGESGFEQAGTNCVFITELLCRPSTSVGKSPPWHHPYERPESGWSGVYHSAGWGISTGNLRCKSHAHIEDSLDRQSHRLYPAFRARPLVIALHLICTADSILA